MKEVSLFLFPSSQDYYVENSYGHYRSSDDGDDLYLIGYTVLLLLLICRSVDSCDISFALIFT